MFTSLQSGFRPQRVSALCSAALHCGLLFWLLHQAEPKFVAPSFVVNGDDGTYLAHLYFPNQQSRIASDAPPGTSAASAAEQLTSHIIWQSRSKEAKQARRKQPRPNVGHDTETSTPGQAAQEHAAGSPLGTVLEGPTTGDEVRPALPVVSPDPMVEAGELNGLQGDVIVEVTIDERGQIIQRIVIQSLAPAIDAKVLEAIGNWRFRPATRNGVPIPSKQDVFYHFPRLRAS
jgi:TonB family protein